MLTSIVRMHSYKIHFRTCTCHTTKISRFTVHACTLGCIYSHSLSLSLSVSLFVILSSLQVVLNVMTSNCLSPRLPWMLLYSPNFQQCSNLQNPGQSFHSIFLKVDLHASTGGNRGHFEAILGQLYIVCESGVIYIFIHLQLCTHV